MSIGIGWQAPPACPLPSPIQPWLRRCVHLRRRTRARDVDVDRQLDPAVRARHVEQALPDGGEGMSDVGRHLVDVEDLRSPGDPEWRARWCRWRRRTSLSRRRRSPPRCRRGCSSRRDSVRSVRAPSASTPCNTLVIAGVIRSIRSMSRKITVPCGKPFGDHRRDCVVTLGDAACAADERVGARRALLRGFFGVVSTPAGRRKRRRVPIPC